MTDQKVESANQHHSAQSTTKHVHHGRTPAAWAGSVIAMVAFFVGGIGIVAQDGLHLFFWIGVVLLALSLIVTLVLQKLGRGAY